MQSQIIDGETISITSASRASRAGLAFETGGLLFILYFIGLNPLLKAFDSPLAPDTVVGLYFPLQFPLQVAFFLGQGRGPSPMLLGVWGVFWVLLGAAVYTSQRAIGLNSATSRRRSETYMEGRTMGHSAS